MRLRCFLAVLLCWGVTLHGDMMTQQSELMLVAGGQFPGEEISLVTLKRLYLGHISMIDGKRITLHQMEGSALKLFCEGILEVSLDNYERRWSRRIFTGKGRVPSTFKDESALLKSLVEVEHGLGFVSSKTVLPDGIRIIRIVEVN